jgi:hypothetical protein
MEVEAGVDALPAAAAERAAMRTAVNAAIGTDQDSLHRASRINRVLKALKERADQFVEAPAPGSAAATVDAAAKQGPLRVNVGGAASATIDAGSSRAARASAAASVRSSAEASRDRSSHAASDGPSDAGDAAPSEPALPISPLPLPGADVDVEGTVEGTVDGLL